MIFRYYNVHKEVGHIDFGWWYRFKLIFEKVLSFLPNADWIEAAEQLGINGRAK
jgi:hypothetical protein